MKQNELKVFDQRTVKRNIKQGLIKNEDYQKFIKTLPDDAEALDILPFEDPEAIDIIDDIIEDDFDDITTEENP